MSREQTSSKASRTTELQCANASRTKLRLLPLITPRDLGYAGVCTHEDLSFLPCLPINVGFRVTLEVSLAPLSPVSSGYAPPVSGYFTLETRHEQQWHVSGGPGSRSQRIWDCPASWTQPAYSVMS